MKRRLALVALACAIAHASDVQAHDFWIEPHDFTPRVGAVLRIALREGDRFASQPYPYDPDRIKSFVLAGADERKPVLGKSGTAIAVVKLDTAGLHRIVYHSYRARNELHASAFERYLLEAGLGRIIEERAARGETGSAAVEFFSRCAKTLICAGGECASDSDQPIGLPLEIIALRNPYQLETGDTLRVRVLYEGRPLGGARVVASLLRDPETLTFATTNPHGDVAVELSEPGAWLITTIQMNRAPAGLDANWVSSWASLTFSLSNSP